MKITKCYDNYKKFKREVQSKSYDLVNDSVGQYNNGEYSVDITLRDYDGIWCIDYDVYQLGKIKKYLDGGEVCKVSKMPLTENGFWKLIKKRFENHIK